MKTIRLYGVVLLIVFLNVGFSSCSKSDDDIVMTPANAKGIKIGFDDTNEYYLWINESVVHVFSEKETTDLSSWYSQNIPYYRFTMDNLYRACSVDRGLDIDEKNFSDHAPRDVDYFKRLLSSYKYFVWLGSSEVYLFNRISNENYNIYNTY